MRLLLSNDDGLDAIGLRHAWEAFDGHDRVVVAPKRDSSGLGHSRSLGKALSVRVQRAGPMEGLVVGGYPADAVRVGLATRGEPFDFMISGINLGENGGLSQLSSGTVAAAREAALWGVPAVSISVWDLEQPAYSAAAAFLVHWIPRWLLRLKQDPWPGLLLNVNFPRCPAAQIRGMQTCRQSVAPFQDRYTIHRGVAEHEMRWKNQDAIAGDTDDWFTQNGFVAVTPLTVDSTSEFGLRWLRAAPEEMPPR